MKSNQTVFGVSWRRAKKFVYGLSIFFLLFSQLSPYGFADNNSGALDDSNEDISSQAIVAKVSPIFECSRDNLDGTYTAFFGYENPNAFSVNIPLGGDNKVTPAIATPPTDFPLPNIVSGRPGRTPFYGTTGFFAGAYAFSADFSAGNVVWTLNGKTSTASTNKICDAICGDSVVQTNEGEQCDDGNTDNGDGCDSSCQYEPVPAVVVDVKPSNLNGRVFTDDGIPTGSYQFDVTPPAAPIGIGSLGLTVDDTGRSTFIAAEFNNVRFADITHISYDAYTPSASATNAVTLQFNYDDDLTDSVTSWQGRLVFEPLYSNTITNDTWQSFDALAGKRWASGNGVSTLDDACPQSSPCTWAEVLSASPNAGISTVDAFGAVLVKLGGPIAGGATSYVDNLRIVDKTIDKTFNFDPDPEQASLVAHKIVCADESYLPNRGKDGGPNLDANSAQDFVDNSNGNCRLQAGRDFEWAAKGVKNPASDHIGPAGGDWNTFGTTDSNGRVETQVPLANLDGILQVREVLKDGYIPFSDDEDDDYSAEFYCHTDVKKYDNLDWIRNPEVDSTYYCIGFNAPKGPNLHITKYLCPHGTDTSSVSIDTNGDLNIDPINDLGCEPHAGVAFGYDNDGVSANGNPLYQPTNYSQIGVTNGSGKLYSFLNPAGVQDQKYLLGELSDDGWVSADDILAFMCTTPPNGNITSNNLEQIDYEKSSVAHCHAFNEEEKIGKLHIKKFVCDADQSFSNDEVRPDANGVVDGMAWDDLAYDGCELADTPYYFDYEYQQGEYAGAGNANAPIAETGTLEVVGMDMFELPSDGRYAIYEQSNDILAFACARDGQGEGNRTNEGEYALFAQNGSGEDVGYCVAINKKIQPETAKIITHKIVCDSESYLPNGEDLGTIIDENTAQDRVDANSDHCRFASDWYFEWADQNAAYPGGDYYGYVASPRSGFGPSDADGMTMVHIPLVGQTRIQIREVLQAGYIDFSDDNGDDFTAEIYCHDDIKNYDNVDWINDPQADETYYCVAFNAPQKLASQDPVCEDGDVYARFATDYDGPLHVGAYTVDANQRFILKDDGVVIPYTSTATEGITLDQSPTGELTVTMHGNGILETALGTLEFINADAVSWSDIPGDNGIDAQDSVTITGDNSGYTVDSFFDVYFDLRVNPANDTFIVEYEEVQDRCTRKPVACDGTVYARLQYDDVDEYFVLEDEYTDGKVRIRKTMTAGKYRFIANEGYEIDGTLTLFNGVYTQLKYSEGGDGLEPTSSVHADSAEISNEYTISFDLGTLGGRKDIFRFRLVDDPICYESGIIQGRKFLDVNQNGTFDDEEKNEAGDPNRLDGWNILLYDDNRNLIDEMETGDDGTAAGNVGKGQYRFVDVAEGTYYVCEEAKDGWIQTRPASGPVDSNTSLNCFEVTLLAGQEKTGLQFGNYKEAICGNDIQEGDEECDGRDGLIEGYTCNEVCLLIEIEDNQEPSEEEEESNTNEENPTQTAGGGAGGSSFPGTLSTPSQPAGPNTSDEGPNGSTPPSLLETGNPDDAGSTPGTNTPDPQLLANNNNPGNANNPVPMLLVTGAEDKAKVSTGISFANVLLVVLIIMLVVFGSGILRKEDSLS